EANKSGSELLARPIVKLASINDANKSVNYSEPTMEEHANGSINVDIINRHINGHSLFDSIDHHQHQHHHQHQSTTNESSTNHSSIVNSFSDVLVSHYRDSSQHQQLPSFTSIVDELTGDETSSSSSSTVPSWNVTLFPSHPSPNNWTNNTLNWFNATTTTTTTTSTSTLTYKNIDCIDSLWDRCLPIVNTSNVTNNLQVLEQHDRDYWGLALIILPILALFGNILVILSVYRERSLQTVTNWFIVSLAFADLFVTIPMLFSLYVMVNVHWELSGLICDLYIAIDVVCSTASIFNLVAISFDRYIAVTHPIFYSKHKNDKRVIVTIILVWMASFGVGLPIMLGANTSPERTPELCIFYNSDFIIYSSLWSFYVPCLIMVILYYKIFKAIHDRARKKLDSTKNKANHYGTSGTKHGTTNNNNNNTNNNRSVASDVRHHLPNIHENVSQTKNVNAIKNEHQHRTSNETRNHMQTTVALISDMNATVGTTDNHNSNNTESHLEDEDEEDEEDVDDVEEGDEPDEIEEIEIKPLKNSCSTQLNNSDPKCNCSMPYANGQNVNVNAKVGHNGCSNVTSPQTNKETMFNGNDKLQPQPTSANESSNEGESSNRQYGTTTTAATTTAEHQSRDSTTTQSGSTLVIGGSQGDSGGSNPSNDSCQVIDIANNGNGTTARLPIADVNGETANASAMATAATVVNNDNGDQSGSNETAIVGGSKYSKKKSRFNLGRKHKSSRKKREKASAKRERKATKTLAIVLGKLVLRVNMLTSTGN
ncbi:G-protein coupled receptor, partial [Blomia tropicalis]